MKSHKVKNLRTLEKAQSFFDDVILFCTDISDERFINEIRQICFAIVVESTDKLYYKNPDENASNNGLFAVRNELEHRVCNYLAGVKTSRNMVTSLLHYYENKTIICKELFDIEYKVFLEAGYKMNYYKSDEEIKVVLPNLRNKMNEASSIPELNRFADEYMVWSDTLEEDNADALGEYKDKLHNMLQKVILEGKEELLDYGVIMLHLSSKKIIDAYSEEIEKMRVVLIETYVKYLQETTKGKQAFDYSYKFRKKFDSLYYRDIIKSFAECLYDRKSFPMGEIDETRYHTCYNIMYVLYMVDKDKFLRYCEELSHICDHMSDRRIKDLVEQITKGGTL